MLADNTRQLDLPNWPFQRRSNSLRADHHVVVAHDADPEIRNRDLLCPAKFGKLLQISALSPPISSEAD
jgi:hypothetical protein